MGHYAKVRQGKVIKVIVADASFFDDFIDDSPGTWIQTSYNTRGNIHYRPNSNEPSPTLYMENGGGTYESYELASASIAEGSGSLPITSSDTSKTLALRGNYAGIGFTYDRTHDAFYAPQPYNSWTLNTGSFLWESPVARPTGDATGSYTGSYSWDEDIQNWVTGSI